MGKFVRRNCWGVVSAVVSGGDTGGGIVCDKLGADRAHGGSNQ